MGLIGGRDAFSSKYITAMIADSENRVHLVPIKNTFGDYFMAEINNNLYAFKIDPKRILIWYVSLAKAFRVMWYTTSHYTPISPDDLKDLEIVITKNKLPKIDRLQFRVMNELGRAETKKKGFEPHEIKKLTEIIEKRPDANTENIRNIKTFLEELNIEKIVTPLRRVTEFIQEDLIATDPQFLGSIPELYLEAEKEGRKVTNAPLGSKHAWVKWIMLIAMIGLIVLVAFWLLSGQSGGFQMPSLDGLIPGLGGGGNPTTQDIMRQYPNPEAAKAAIDRGELDYNKLPPELKRLVDNVKLPTVTPKEETVELTP